MDKVQYISEKGYRISKDGIVVNTNGKELSGSKSNRGYLKFSIRIGGETCHINFHRLQAFQKYGDIIFNAGVVCRHIDGDKFNNSWDNIEIGTQSQNMMDRPAEERLAHAKHASSFIQKHNHEEIKEFHAIHKSYKKTMYEFGINSKGSLNYILKGRK